MKARTPELGTSIGQIYCDIEYWLVVYLDVRGLSGDGLLSKDKT
jgi:hypothetical protein